MEHASSWGPGNDPMHLLCPHCYHPIELNDPAAQADFLCPSCGSTVRLANAGSTRAPSAGARSVGRFLLLAEVGCGAFGTVYKARDPELDRVVALKVPRAGAAPSGEHLERFLREARSAAQL